jgi:tetratricopeptide (TPR) repeat protein
LWTLDSPEDALVHAKKAFSIDPESVGPRTTLGTTYIMLRSFTEAEREFRELLRKDSRYVASYRAFSYIHEHQGQYDKAVEELNTALGIAPEDPIVLSAMGRLLALQKKPAEARGIIDRMREIENSRHVSPILFAEVFAELGDFDRAMAELDKAEREHSAYMPLIADRLTLKALRGDPRFIALLKRLKIPY